METCIQRFDNQSAGGFDVIIYSEEPIDRCTLYARHYFGDYRITARDHNRMEYLWSDRYFHTYRVTLDYM